MNQDKNPKPSDPVVDPSPERCGTCGHSRAHHIGLDGPCNVHRGREFCDCDHFSRQRIVAPNP